MNRVLMCSLQVGAGASKGHVHPLLGVAERLVASGREVVWTSVPHALADDDRAAVERTGARVTTARLRSFSSPDRDGRGEPSAAELSRRTLDPHRAWEVYRGFLVDPIDALVPELVRIIREERIAVVAGDSLAYAAFVAARLAGVPFATLCAGWKLAGSSELATGYRFDLSLLEEPRGAAFARHGVRARFHMLECLSQELVVMFATRDVVGDLPGVLLAGPSRSARVEPPFAGELDGRPLVVMAFGSVHTHEDLADVVAPFQRAAAARDAQVVISSVALAERGVPGAYRDIPQRALLARAAAFITHGGANSVAEALDAGVPPIIVPLSGDQRLQARIVEDCGAGLGLERADVNDATAAAALDRASSLRDGAQRIRDAWRGVDGALVAARAIAGLA